MMQSARRPRRWRRVPPPPPAPVIQLRGRAASRVLAAHYGGTEPQPSAFYRFRHQLPPAAWGVLLAAASLSLRLAGVSPAPVVIAAAACAGLILVFSRHLSRYGRRACMAVAALTAFWLPVMSALGFRPWLAFFAACWAALLGVQAHHYRIRENEEPGPTADEETWSRLCEHKRWNASLGKPVSVPGGRAYAIQCDGIQTHIRDIVGQPLSVAAAWHKAITEAYAEPSPDGVASRGRLTILTAGTLQAVRHWDGNGVTEDGLARIGRFADAMNAHIRVCAPMDGARHSLIAGSTGAGKSELLNLLLHVYLTSGWIFPVVLDPQEGQSLPDWQGHLPYAAGTDECMEMLELIHDLMYSRSRQLAQMTWDDNGHQRKMSFFDRHQTGWPLVRVIADEAHVLLTGGTGREDKKRASRAIEMFKDLAKLGRKTGVGVDLVTQVPTLEELGSQVLRSMLRGGNVICLRTADSVSGTALGLPADPHDIPQYFPDGSFTYGLGYVLGPERRQAIARTDITSAAQRRRRYALPELEPASRAILARFGQPRPGQREAAAVTQAAVDDSPAPGGQTASDAILAVLTGEMTRGDLIKAARAKSLEWGRGKPFEMRSITTALSKLVDDGRVARTDHGVYAPVRPSLSLIGEA